MKAPRPRPEGVDPPSPGPRGAEGETAGREARSEQTPAGGRRAASPSTTSLRLAPAKPPTGEELELGHVFGSFGVRGEVRLHLHHRESTLFTTARAVVLLLPDGSRLAARLRTRAGAGLRVLGRIEGIDRPEDADLLADAKVLLARADLPPPADDEIYVADLLGASVQLAGVELGKVLDVHDTAACSILEVGVGGGTEFLPLHARWVERVDAGVIHLIAVPWETDA